MMRHLREKSWWGFKRKRKGDITFWRRNTLKPWELTSFWLIFWAIVRRSYTHKKKSLSLKTWQTMRGSTICDATSKWLNKRNLSKMKLKTMLSALLIFYLTNNLATVWFIFSMLSGFSKKEIWLGHWQRQKSHIRCERKRVHTNWFFWLKKKFAIRGR